MGAPWNGSAAYARDHALSAACSPHVTSAAFPISDRSTFATDTTTRCACGFPIFSISLATICADRKHQLEKLVCKLHDSWLRYSESFTDSAAPRRRTDRMGIEGIVS